MLLFQKNGGAEQDRAEAVGLDAVCLRTRRIVLPVGPLPTECVAVEVANEIASRTDRDKGFFCF